MSELVVVAFDNEAGALQMHDALIGLQQQRLITLDDAAVVVRLPNGRVRVKQAVELVGNGVLGGAFWGMFVGLLFWLPWLGNASSGPTGALENALSDDGLDDRFVEQVLYTIWPGHSALFLLIREATPDRLLQELKQFNARLMLTALSPSAEAKLKRTFGVFDA